MHSLFSTALLLFFFTDPATTEIYTLSLHDALPISISRTASTLFADSLERLLTNLLPPESRPTTMPRAWISSSAKRERSEEHTSELQSLTNLVCRLLLEKKKKTTQI